jgi:hypothetical protein
MVAVIGDLIEKTIAIILAKKASDGFKYFESCVQQSIYANGADNETSASVHFSSSVVGMTFIARPGCFATLLVPALHFGGFQKFRTFNHRLSADGTLVPHLRKCFSLCVIYLAVLKAITL